MLRFTAVEQLDKGVSSKGMMERFPTASPKRETLAGLAFGYAASHDLTTALLEIELCLDCDLLMLLFGDEGGYNSG